MIEQTTSINRRHFLWLLATLSAGAAGAWAFKNKKIFDFDSDYQLGTLIVGNFGGSVMGHDGFLTILDLDRQEHFNIDPHGEFYHGFYQFPTQPSLVATTTKWETSGAVVDIQSKKVVEKFKAEKGRQFVGHGTLSRDGKHLYLSEIIYEPGYTSGKWGNHGVGYIGIWSLENMKKVDEVSSFGIEPHEMRVWSLEDDSIIVLNAGASEQVFTKVRECSVAIIDMAQKKLIKKILPDIPNQMLAHFDRSGDRVFMGGCELSPNGAICSGRMAILDKDKMNIYGSQPAKDNVKSQANILSVSYNKEYDIVATTHPTENLVFFWRGDTGEALKTLKINANGVSITKNQKYFVLTSQRGLKFYRTDNLEEDTKVWQFTEKLMGSHSLIV